MEKHVRLGLVAALTLTGLASCDLYSTSQDTCQDTCACYGSDFNGCEAAGCGWDGAECVDNIPYYPPPDGGYPNPGPGSACAADLQCAAGFYCDNGGCAVGGFCSTTSPCFTSGFSCDTYRSTCQPSCMTAADCAPNDQCDNGVCVANVISCGGAVTCSTAQPTCGSGQVPTITNGCWTGNCIAIGSCDVPPACSEINDETDCLARSDCGGVYTGIDCTDPSGAACKAGDTGCTCASFVFASCENKP